MDLIPETAHSQIKIAMILWYIIPVFKILTTLLFIKIKGATGAGWKCHIPKIEMNKKVRLWCLAITVIMKQH
jgi:hypothetical protein